MVSKQKSLFRYVSCRS